MAVINKTTLYRSILLGLIFWAMAAPQLFARTSLVALPQREQVIIRLADSNATLVQEKRMLTLKKGVNQIDFSWQNVSIDPLSITLNPLCPPDQIRLLSVSYPPNKDALVWELYSSKNVEQDVIISYLLRGIDNLITHEAVVDTKEQHLNLNSFLILRNFSGENFVQAQIHLDTAPGFDTSVSNLETKRILYFEKQNIPITKVYTWDAAKLPHDPEKTGKSIGIPRGYEIKNTLKSGLGTQDLPPGKTRVFQVDSHDTTIFSGEDKLAYLPVGDKTLLQTGDSRDILVTKRTMETRQINPRKNTQGKTQVHDQILKVQFKIENFKDSPLTLCLIDHIQGEWEPISIDLPYTRKDHKTLVFKIPLGAKEKKTLNLEYKVMNIFVKNFRQFNRVSD
ncbi:MAG: DUF4139 domain-containing protein [Desulfobacteraceae bacterium]|nr:DUF4139 domain-containing protein [Desulfobacteraceae bacterium]